MDEQSPVIDFLSRPESYGTPDARVERVETHCSIVFLVGGYAYKLKRAIAYSSLNYLGVERRERACRAELALNRRTAPAIYLDLRSIKRGPDTTLAFDGPGEVQDWVVVMRRFPQADLFNHLVQSGRLTPALIGALGEEIARLHATAEITPERGGSAGIRSAIENNHGQLLQLKTLLGGPAVDELRAASLAVLRGLVPLLERRRQTGKVRRCHGDLRLANICLFEGRPTLFDCVEFSDDISCIDVLYDLAFVLMDLEHHGLAGYARNLLDAYLRVTGDEEGCPALPLFLSIRAATRCYAVAGSALRQSEAEAADHHARQARSLLALAAAYLRPDATLFPAPIGIASMQRPSLATPAVP